MAAVLHGFGRPVDLVNKLIWYKRHPNPWGGKQNTNDDDAAFCCRFGVDRKADGCADTCVYGNRSGCHQQKGFHDMKTK